MSIRWGADDRRTEPMSWATQVSDRELRAAAERGVASGVSATGLYRRWEQQHWLVDDLDLAEDRAGWDELGESAREILTRLMTSFFVGEYTAVDGLSAVMRGAPDEDELVFLATQTSDEARHVTLMNTIDTELLGSQGGLKARLPELWANLTPAYRALQQVEDSLAADVHARPDVDTWLRLVSVFHLLTEGVLAINGQQAVIRTLREHARLPRLEAGFASMMRDESRHIAYGTQAARSWVARGYEANLLEALELAVPHVVHIDDVRADQRSAAHAQIIGLIDKRLAAVGVSRAGRDHIRAVASRPYALPAHVPAPTPELPDA